MTSSNRRLRFGAATLATAVALLAPEVASAVWKVEGRGFGHGAGLSQYGAYGFAKHGRSYKQILAHYYSGTSLGKLGGGSGGGAGGGTQARRAGGKSVRVLLGTASSGVGFSGAARACGKRLNPSRTYELAGGAGGVELRRGGRRVAGCGKEGKASGRVVRIDGFGSYRGSLVARADGGGLLVINQLAIDAYVKGVVPNEVPTSWPEQALRAQAVVARSYGIATERSGPFDHYDDTRSQVYRGKSSETKATNRAVEATAKQIVKYKGETAITYYFSTSGGRTENSEFAFSGGNKIPYLKSVKDPFDDASPVHTWNETFSHSQMESELTGLFSGKLQRIEILETGRSPRIVRARVVGSNGSQTVTGDTLRARLGLRSTWARFKHD
jgi:stage II sporulation protein D